MQIISRSDWGARAPRKVSPIKRHDNWYIHWEGTVYPKAMSEAQVVQSIQRFHMDTRVWRDIAYGWVIFNSGHIYEGAGWGVMGTATLNKNSTSQSICFAIGPGEKPSAAALAAAAWLIEQGRKRGYAPRTLPHSAAKPTQCPGPELRTWATTYIHAYHEEQPMTNRQIVESMYGEVLPGHADEVGIAFWVGKLDRGEMHQVDLLQHFTAVRLGALQAEVAAIKQAMVGATSIGDIAKARTDFYAELRAWAAALPQS